MALTIDETVKILRDRGVPEESITQALNKRRESAMSQLQGQNNSLGGKFRQGASNVLDAIQQIGGITPRKNNFNEALQKTLGEEQAKSLFPESSTRGVFAFNPTTGKLEQVSSIPSSGIVRNTSTPEDIASKAGARERGSFEEQKKIQEEVLNSARDERGNLPVGTSQNIGGVTIPLNPKLTDAEQSAVVGKNLLRPRVNEIVDQIRSGILSKRGNDNVGDMERTTRQFGVDSTNAFLTFADPQLQSLQSNVQSLRRLIPFTDGGKQLTPFEAEQVFALLKFAGKSDDQIVSDLSKAIEIVEAKGGLAISGARGSDSVFQKAVESESNNPNQGSIDLGEGFTLRRKS